MDKLFLQIKAYPASKLGWYLVRTVRVRKGPYLMNSCNNVPHSHVMHEILHIHKKSEITNIFNLLVIWRKPLNPNNVQLTQQLLGFCYIASCKQMGRLGEYLVSRSKTWIKRWYPSVWAGSAGLGWSRRSCMPTSICFTVIAGLQPYKQIRESTNKNLIFYLWKSVLGR